MRTKKKNIKNKRKTYKKKIDKRKRKRKRKTITKGQKGGGVILPAVGIGLAATAVAAAAYKGFRLISKIKDKSHILRLLNQDYIEYAPKVVVTETKDFINHYLNCVSTLEFFQILLSRPEYLTSKTLRSLIKEKRHYMGPCRVFGTIYENYIKENKEDIINYVKKLKIKQSLLSDSKKELRVSVYNMKCYPDYKTLETDLKKLLEKI